MKILHNRYTITLAAVFWLAGCDPKFAESVENFEPSAGDADFSTFVTVGDSLTAGFKDSALYREGQKNSYGKILSRQFAQVGGGNFTQPLMPVGATGDLSIMPAPSLGRSNRLVLEGTGNPDRPVTPVEINNPQITAIDTRVGNGGFNNLGVPGAKSFHLGVLPNGYGELSFAAIVTNMTANPYFARFSSSDAATIIGDAAALMPTFFILWIGNNDILLNATTGSDGANPVFGTGMNDVTPTATFAAAYPGLVATLTASSPDNKGILINVPNVSSIPYFTTVPWDAIELTASEAADLNAQLAAGYDAALNAAIGAIALDPDEAERRRLSFKKGDNPVLISDDTLQDISPVLIGPLAPFALLAQARPATEDDLILLPTSAKLGEEDPMGGPGGAGGALAVWGVTQPLLDGDVLIKPEADAIEAVRQSYNATIKTAADADPDLLLLDAAALLDELNESGLSYGSGGISSAFIQGGGFSLDGVHPTARGYAVVANEIIKLINEGFNANVAPVDPNRFDTTFYQD